MKMHLRPMVISLLAALLVSLPYTSSFAKEIRTSAQARFSKAAQSPIELRAFLYAMPKGADLHYHLTGGTYAENLIKAGASKGICINIETFAAAPPPCDSAANLRAMSDALRDFDLNRKIVNAWSMRNFVPSAGFSGHDQFFKPFGLFGNAIDLSALVAEVVSRAAMQRLLYMELMISLQTQAIRQIASGLHWTEDFDSIRQKLVAAGIDQVVADAVRDLDEIEMESRRIDNCSSTNADPGCNVELRYLAQTSRTGAPEVVFAQTLLGFLLARKDHRVVGINFVGAEDNPVALANYSLHMKMLRYFKTIMPEVNVALHAGELTLGLVPPEELRNHIRDAVTIGGAARIGHGIDVMYEERPYDLLRTLSKGRIAVEVAFTSNQVILGISGKYHPFSTYRRFNVPVVIATDDEGVSRTDLTNELVIAVTNYGLGYHDIVAMQRGSLEHSFLPGQSLWEQPENWQMTKVCRHTSMREPTSSCSEFLQANKKAAIQWKFEQLLKEFEDALE